MFCSTILADYLTLKSCKNEFCIQTYASTWHRLLHTTPTSQKQHFGSLKHIYTIYVTTFMINTKHIKNVFKKPVKCFCKYSPASASRSGPWASGLILVVLIINIGDSKLFVGQSMSTNRSFFAICNVVRSLTPKNSPRFTVTGLSGRREIGSQAPAQARSTPAFANKMFTGRLAPPS